MFNIQAPSVVEEEYTAGVKYKWSENLDIELTGMCAPENSLSGFELATVANPNHQIEVSMYQWEITGGITWKFGLGAAPAPLKWFPRLLFRPPTGRRVRRPFLCSPPICPPGPFPNAADSARPTLP
jgi:hypothetical protein